MDIIILLWLITNHYMMNPNIGSDAAVIPVMAIIFFSSARAMIIVLLLLPSARRHCRWPLSYGEKVLSKPIIVIMMSHVFLETGKYSFTAKVYDISFFASAHRDALACCLPAT